MAGKFRTAFEFTKSINWFPGHMNKGLHDIKERMVNIDFIIEVRDARVPISSMNPEFEKIVKNKKRLIIYNKADLAPLDSQITLSATLGKMGIKNFMYNDINSPTSVRKIMSIIKDQYNENPDASPKIMSMVVGMPNVGKSSIVNALRTVGTNKGKAVRTGAFPGVTRKMATSVKILNSPEIYLYDTPGVMIPYVANPLSSLKFALTGGIKDNILDYESLSDYLLFMLNQSNNTKYLEIMGLEEPTDDINFLLPHVARKTGALLKGGIPQLDVAAQFFVRQYRHGKFGYFCLDDVTYPEVVKAIAEANDINNISKNQTRKQMLRERKEKALERLRSKLEKKKNEISSNTSYNSNRSIKNGKTKK